MGNVPGHHHVLLDGDERTVDQVDALLELGKPARTDAINRSNLVDGIGCELYHQAQAMEDAF